MAHEELHLNLRNLKLEDYEQLQKLMDRVYDDIEAPGPRTRSKLWWNSFQTARSALRKVASW